MTDLTVIYDPSLEIGAIVDLDTNMGWGPMCPGPRGGELLQAYVDGMPFDLAILKPEQARDIFLSVFRDDATAAIEAKTETDTDQVGVDADPSTDAQALATAEATVSGGEPPAVQPADTDMAADTSETAPVTPDPTSSGTITDGEMVASTTTPIVGGTANCLICNPTGTGSNNSSCPVCGGTGHVPKAQ